MTSHAAGMDVLPCGYVEVGPDGVIASANSRFLTLVGLTADAVVGTLTFSGLLAVGDRIYYETHFRPTLQMQGEIHEIAFELVRPDGDRVPILVSASTSDDESPVTRTIVFEARDRRRYEKELLRARRAAEDAEAHSLALATTLQQTFIPPTMPDIPGLEIAGAYRPAGDGSEVGGDFYDAFQIHSGEWVVVVGDVCGKGVDAAVLTSFVRHTLRALAVQWDDPSQILRELNAALLAHDSDRFCTVVVLRLLRDDDSWLVSVSSGGHPLPILVAVEGAVTEVGASGSLIGVLSMPQLDDDRFTIHAGDSLVVYTDGVTDARGAAGTFGIDGLFGVVSGGVTSAADTTDTVLGQVLDFQDGEARDDIAIVTLRALAADAGLHAPDAVQARPDVEEKNRALRALQGLEQFEA